jgi:hypothetical protein
MTHWHVWRVTLDGKGRKLHPTNAEYAMRTLWLTEQAAALDKVRFEKSAEYNPRVVQYDIRPCDGNIVAGGCYAKVQEEARSGVG